MPVPDYQALMLPLLRRLEDSQVHQMREIVSHLADEFRLTPDELAELLPSMTDRKFNNRVGWARTYLLKAGLLDSPERGKVQITSRGKEVLAQGPSSITYKFLNRFPEFREFQTSTRKTASRGTKVGESGPATPAELLESNHRTLRSQLADELLSTVKSCSPRFFESVVVDLLVAMGYGGSRADAGQALGGSHDEGIDGVIKEDRLGLDTIYLQAKRWSAAVGRPEVQRFVGSLEGQKARKGIMITTSRFTPEALDYVGKVDKRVVLIGGAELAELMIDRGIGVTTVATYDVKKLDTDYFTEGS